MGMHVWEPEDDQDRAALKKAMREQEGATLAADILDRLDSWELAGVQRDAVRAAISSLDAILKAADAALDAGRLTDFEHWAEAADKTWGVVSEMLDAVTYGLVGL